MFAALLTLALSQVPATAESFPQLQDPTSPDLNLASRFIEEHLISFQYNSWTGIELRQGATVFKPGESLVEAVQLVPQAMQLARQADDEFRISRILTYVGLGVTLVGFGIETAGTFVLAGSAFPVLVVVGAGIAILGLIAVLVALPYSIAYQTHLLQLVATYNTGIVREMRHGVPTTPEAIPAAPIAPGVLREAAPKLLQLAAF